MPKVDNSIDWVGAEEKWEKIMALRDEVLRELEGLRQEQKIGSSQEAVVTVYFQDEKVAEILNEFGLQQFAELCIVSEVKLQSSAGEAKVVAEKSAHQKCQRCWNYRQSVGADSKYRDLCERCVSVVRRA
jgi:isoleucyl-tRNA synthetase